MAERNIPVKAASSASGESLSYPIEQELGITNIMPTGSWMDWYGSNNIPPGTMAVGRDPNAPSVDEMVMMIRRDGLARALLSLLTLPIRAAFKDSKWIEPDGGAAEETAFANQMWDLPSNIGGMSVAKSMFLRQTLLALAHGFSAFEIVRAIPKDGPLKGKIIIKKLAYRDPRTVTFLADDHGVYQGFRQRTNFAGRMIDVVIPKQDSWYYAANEEENPMYGISFFEPAFKHYQMKWKMYYIGNLAAQFAAVPGRIGKVPLGASTNQIRQFKKDIANFAFNTSMLAPPNFEVDNFNGNSNFDFLKIIDHHNTMMASSVLAKFLQQDDHTVLIQSGSSDASADLFVQMLEAIADELSESWTNRLMPQFIDLNFGSGKYPVHQFAPLTDANKDRILAIFEAVVAATTLNCTPEFVRQMEMHLTKEFGFDIDYTAIQSEEEQMAAEQQKVNDAQQAQQQAMQDAQQKILENQANNPGLAAGPKAPGAPKSPASPNSNSTGFTNQYSRAGSPNRTVGTSYVESDLDQDDKVILSLTNLLEYMNEQEGEEVVPEAQEGI